MPWVGLELEFLIETGSEGRNKAVDINGLGETQLTTPKPDWFESGFTSRIFSLKMNAH